MGCCNPRRQPWGGLGTPGSLRPGVRQRPGGEGRRGQEVRLHLGLPVAAVLDHPERWCPVCFRYTRPSANFLFVFSFTNKLVQNKHVSLHRQEPAGTTSKPGLSGLGWLHAGQPEHLLPCAAAQTPPLAPATRLHPKLTEAPSPAWPPEPKAAPSPTLG